MAEKGIADHFAHGADWIARLRTRRRVRYERATHARPDYGRPPPRFEFFHLSDGILLAVGSALRAVAFMGYGIGVVLLIVLGWIILTFLGVLK
jgi:hypothetical protein